MWLEIWFVRNKCNIPTGAHADECFMLHHFLRTRNGAQWVNTRGQAYWEKDPLHVVVSPKGIFKQTLRGVQEPHDVDSSLFIPPYQEGGLIWRLRGGITENKLLKSIIQSSARSTGTCAGTAALPGHHTSNKEQSEQHETLAGKNKWKVILCILKCSVIFSQRAIKQLKGILIVSVFTK